jgi:cobyrinic acid a,c-diamide synthase
MLPPELIGRVLARQAHDADIALIEGVMGLFDGYSGRDDSGSTAHIARLTDTPVLVVLDARSMARTAAALVKGLHDFDPQVRVAGVILNRVGSPKHVRMLTDAIESSVGVPVAGYLGREETLHLPERHLGLVPTSEPGRWQGWIEQARVLVETSVDIERVLDLAGWDDNATRREGNGNDDATSPHPPVVLSHPRAIIAVARDTAFSFLYEQNLDLLREAGARIVFFSPLHDTALPGGTQALYLCGGFPELYAAELAANTSMRAAIRAAAESDMPVYAECGGLMYLTESLRDQEGSVFPMVGVLQGQSEMTKRLTLGYRTIQGNGKSWLWREGETMRGHEFHYSAWQPHPPPTPACTILADEWQSEPRSEGAKVRNTIASYVHLHFLAYPALAERFVAAAAAWPQGEEL